MENRHLSTVLRKRGSMVRSAGEPQILGATLSNPAEGEARSVLGAINDSLPQQTRCVPDCGPRPDFQLCISDCDCGQGSRCTFVRAHYATTSLKVCTRPDQSP